MIYYQYHILKIKCPKCNEYNWVNNGDIDDLTVSDIEAVKCWSCKHKFFLDEENIRMFYDDENLKPDDVMMEYGKQNPSDLFVKCGIKK